MIASYQDAEDEVYAIATGAWKAVAPSTAKLFYFGELSESPAIDKFYAEASFKVVNERQASLSNYQGKSKYEAVGLFSFQIYSPKRDATALRQANAIAEAVKNAFRKPSPSGSISFTRQRSTPVTGNEARNQVNVVVTCTYYITK